MSYRLMALWRYTSQHPLTVLLWSLAVLLPIGWAVTAVPAVVGVV